MVGSFHPGSFATANTTAATTTTTTTTTATPLAVPLGGAPVAVPFTAGSSRNILNHCGGRRRHGSSSSLGVDRNSPRPPTVLHSEWIVLPSPPPPSTPSSNQETEDASSGVDPTLPLLILHVTVVLHGLLGNLKNVQPLAAQLLRARRSRLEGTPQTSHTCSCLLMDLTGHGRSAAQQQHPVPNTIHRSDHPTTPNDNTNDNNSRFLTLNDVARDVIATVHRAVTAQYPDSTTIDVSIELVGHSLGGRIALHAASHWSELVQELKQYTHNNDDDRLPPWLPPPTHVWLLDTVPDAVDASVRQVLNVAQTVANELSESSTTTIWSRADLVARLQSLGLTNNMAVVHWLAAQYNRTTRAFSFDLDAANALARDLLRQDFWGQLQRLLLPVPNATITTTTVATTNKPSSEHTTNINKTDNDDRAASRATKTSTIMTQPTRVHLVVGGKNPAWSSSVLERIQELQQQHQNAFSYHILPNAGHWVHTDDLPGLLVAFASIDETEQNEQR